VTPRLAPRRPRDPDIPSLPADPTAASVFIAVLTRGPIARNEIAQVLGLSPATVSKAVRPLLEAGYLVESGPAVEPDLAGTTARPGRPLVPLRVVADREFVLGIKLAGTHAVGVAVDLLANVRASRRVALPSHDVDAVVQTLAALADALSADLGGGPVTRIGVGVGGHVDARRGLVRYAPFLEWRDIPLADLLTTRVGQPVVVENDVNSLTVAEQWFGSGLDVPSFAVVTIGAGIGCGFVVDGSLVHGAHGLAGELGHVPIVHDGPRCLCGHTGCVEALASDEAILARVRAATGRPDLDLQAAVRLARDGDPAATAAFTAAGDALGRALAVVANLLNPYRIVLSGEGLAASDLFEQTARESFARHAFGQAVECELVTRPLPDDTWARGAAAVAISHLFTGPIPGVPLR
jgi:predicted NBD/HSP70 family sugar kinase/DNA-binding transcriptional ArsR family regulator